MANTSMPTRTMQIFPSMLTNMFPVANDTNGGQLVSEWNLKQTDSVMGNPRIQWASYPSYAQTSSDFALAEVGGTEPASLFIGKVSGLSNRAIIDGHFLEVLGRQRINLLSKTGIDSAIDADILESGTYEIGLVAVYSGDSTLASQPPGRETQIAGTVDGTTKLFGQSGMFGGVAVVIGKVGDDDKRLRTPADCWKTTDRDRVNCHLKLGSFVWQQEVIQGVVGGGIADGSVVNYSSGKLQFIGAERIINSGEGGSSHSPFTGKDTVDPSKLYAYSTRKPEQDEGEFNHDVWTDITFDMLNLLQARIEYDENSDRVSFVAPYKRNPYQIDNYPLDNEFRFVFPNANPAFQSNAGMMGKYYKDKIEELIRMNDALVVGSHKYGRLKRVIDSLTEYSTTFPSLNSLPPISNNFESGDAVYILKDFLANDRDTGRPASPIEASDIDSVPSTMRVITTTPERESDIRFFNTISIPSGTVPNPANTQPASIPLVADFTVYVDSLPTTETADGIEVAEKSSQRVFSLRADRFIWNNSRNTTGPAASADGSISADQDFPIGLSGGDTAMNTPQNITSNDANFSDTGWGEIRKKLFEGRALDGFEDSSSASSYVRVVICHPQIPAIATSGGNPAHPSGQRTHFRQIRLANIVKDWSNALWLTPRLPLAKDDSRGAVYSIPLDGDNANDFLDKGYCYIDEFGYIRLMDYDDLYAGGAWKFLKDDYETLAGQNLNELRLELEVMVHKRASIKDNVVKVWLPDRDDSGGVARSDEVLNIVMGSVYQGSTTFIFEGSADAIPVQFTDCDRIRIIDNTAGELEIAIRNSELYYDASIIQQALTVGTRSGIFGIRFWYKEFFAATARVREYPEVFRHEERDPTGRLIVNGSEYTTADQMTVHFHGNSNWFSLATFSPGEAGVNVQARICDLQFSPSGIITAIGLQMRNATTQFNMNILEPAKGMTFMMPVAISFGSVNQIPQAALKDSISLQGKITTMYERGDGWMFMEMDVNIATESIAEDNEIGVRGGTVLIHFQKVEKIDNVVDRTEEARKNIALNNAWAANTPVYVKGRT